MTKKKAARTRQPVRQVGPDTAERGTDPIRVLFLCTGNAARSQIAEALLLSKGGSRFRVASAGSDPAQRVHSETIEVLRVAGIEWVGRSPKGYDAVASEEWDFILTLCDRGKESCPQLPGQPVYGHWGVPDPAQVEGAARARAFETTVRLLAWRIDLMLSLRPELLERDAAERGLRRIGESRPDSI